MLGIAANSGEESLPFDNEFDKEFNVQDRTVLTIICGILFGIWLLAFAIMLCAKKQGDKAKK